MKLKCEFCGKIFESERKKKYCYDIECLKKRHVELVRKSQNKKKLEKGGKVVRKTIKNEENTKSNEIDAIQIYEEHKNENNIVYEKEIIIDEGFGDLIEIARNIGTLRYDLIQQIQKVVEKIREHDKLEQDLLHKLEFAQQLTEAEAIEISVSLKKNREARRVVKNSKDLISILLSKGLPLRSPEKYVRKAIEIVKNKQYNPRALNSLFEEEEENKNNDQRK